MQKVFEVKKLDNYILRGSEIISRKTVTQSELNKTYPERTVFEAKDDDDILVLKVGELVVVPLTTAGDEPMFSIFSVLQ